MGIPAIKLSGIRKSYLGSEILKDVNLSLDQGQFCALIGKNGVGKSTLMRLIVRQELPTAGDAWIFGRDLKSDSSFFGEEVGYVSESIDYALPVSIGVFFQHYGKAFPKWDQRRFLEIIDRMGIGQESSFRSLSRGQRMQVAFAAAVASRPKILILDEITSVLDANARAYFMSHLGDFTKEGGTVLLATNIISEVHHYANRLILLHEGTAKFNLTMDELTKIYSKLRKPQNSSHPIFEDSDCVEVALNSDGSLSYVVPTSKISQHKVPDSFLDKRGITAEEVFIYFTRSRFQ